MSETQEKDTKRRRTDFDSERTRSNQSSVVLYDALMQFFSRSTPTITAEMMAHYRCHKNDMFDLWKRAHGSASADSNITIVSYHRWSLKKFLRWASITHDSAFLFCELDERNVGIFFKYWDLYYVNRSKFPFLFCIFPLSYNDCLTCTKGIYGLVRVEERTDFIPLDPDDGHSGGPSEAFLSKVWLGMGDLEVEAPGGRKTTLFGTTYSGFLRPAPNGFLQTKLGLLHDPEEARGLVHRYYRALGRILLYCIAQNIPIASIVLPQLYRNYLLKGLTPENSRYRLPDLVRDVLEMVHLEHREGDYSDAMRQYLLIVNGEETPVNEDAFRAKIKEDFIDDCDIALDALKEGLSLDGKYCMMYRDYYFHR